MAESVIRLFKAEVIHRRGPWRGFDDVEYATLEWVAWFNQRRLLEPLGYVPAYAGHRENPVGKVWWPMKQQVTANRLYGDVERLVAAVDRCFDAFTPSAALALAA